MVYRFYCMALFHSQTRRHMIKFTIVTFRVWLSLSPRGKSSNILNSACKLHFSACEVCCHMCHLTYLVHHSSYHLLYKQIANAAWKNAAFSIENFRAFIIIYITKWYMHICNISIIICKFCICVRKVF